MPIQSGQVGRYGIKATPDINGPHKGIPWRSPALSNAAPTINGRTHDSTGAILANCTVWAMNTQTDAIAGSTTSDANGLFSLTLYTSGSFYLVSSGTVSSVSSVFPAQLSLSRASSGTHYNSSGIITTESSNVARLDYTYDGAAWNAAGLLIEEQRTNLILQSQFGGASWTNGGSTTTANATISPDGTTNAPKLVESAGGGEHRIFQALGSGNYTTCTLFAKKAERNWVAIRSTANSATANFNIDTGTIGTTGGSSFVSASIQNVGNGWFRCVHTETITNSQFFTINMGDADTGTASSYSYTGDGTSGLYLWGAQTENGAPTSYIPTTTAQVTRSADIVSSTDAGLLAAQGWIVEVGELPGSTDATLLGINTAIGIGATSANALTTADGGSQTTANTGTWTSQNRGGLAFDSTPRVSIDLNGGTVVTAANTPVTPTNLYFGNTNNGASGFLNGHIRIIAAYSAITDLQLPALSTVGAAVTSVLTPTFSIQWGGGSAVVTGTTVNTLIPT